jgi:translation initiation factor 6 (eIF-6)
LDFSWNKIGGNGKPSCATYLADLLKSNESLLHVDFSNNLFDNEESNIIAEGLNKNHTIYGFHFKGNYGYVDNRGFLVIDEIKDEQTEIDDFMRIDGKI